jgi:hypothetical protein
LKLKCDEPLSNDAFNCNLRRYIQELLPKRVLAEAGATVSGVSVFEVADTSAGHAALGLRVSVSTPAAAAAVAKVLKRHQTNGATITVPAACVADAGPGGRAMAAQDTRPTLSARQAGLALDYARHGVMIVPTTTFCRGNMRRPPHPKPETINPKAAIDQLA